MIKAIRHFRDPTKILTKEHVLIGCGTDRPVCVMWRDYDHMCTSLQVEAREASHVTGDRHLL